MSERKIIDAVQILSDTKLADKVSIISAEVISVDLKARSCTVRAMSGDSEIEIGGVLLMASVDDGLLIEPAEGSTVLVTYSLQNQPFVSMYSAIASVYLDTGNSTAKFENDKIIFNGGNKGGLINIAELVTKLNNLEAKLNTVISTFNSHFHPASSGTTSPTLTPVAGTLTPTQRADIEDTKITH